MAEMFSEMLFYRFRFTGVIVTFLINLFINSSFYTCEIKRYCCLSTDALTMAICHYCQTAAACRVLPDRHLTAYTDTTATFTNDMVWLGYE